MTSKTRILMARGKPCPYCGLNMNGKKPNHAHAPTRDRVNPKAKGGGPTIICCRGCNLDKGNRTLSEWATLLYRRHDFRRRRVRELADALEAGTLQIIPHLRMSTNLEAYAIGLAVGVFV